MTRSCSACALINEDCRDHCSVCDTPRAGRSSAGNAERSYKRERTSPQSLSERVGWDQCITLDPTSGESLDEWLEAVRPSQVSPMQCAWISINNVTPNSPGYYQTPTTMSVSSLNDAVYKEALSKIEGIIASGGGRVKAAEKFACVESILATAKSRGDTVGKWMLFRNHQSIDEIWKSIAKATADGTLGCAAKVAPAGGIGDNKPVLVCVCPGFFRPRRREARVAKA